MRPPRLPLFLTLSLSLTLCLTWSLTQSQVHLHNWSTTWLLQVPLHDGSTVPPGSRMVNALIHYPPARLPEGPPLVHPWLHGVRLDPSGLHLHLLQLKLKVSSHGLWLPCRLLEWPCLCPPRRPPERSCLGPLLLGCQLSLCVLSGHIIIVYNSNVVAEKIQLIIYKLVLQVKSITFSSSIQGFATAEHIQNHCHVFYT